jgi:diguanylate cyclase (GGDEF)-like protein
MQVVVPADAAAELIITDGDGADEIFSTVATHGPQCPVTDRRECAAMRRGGTQRFTNAEAISACPHLSGRDISRATCIPTTFLGHPLGVLHIVEGSGSDAPLDEPLLVELAATAANRIGTMRAFAREESHARVDPLTGLLNRRAFERQTAVVARGVLAMADLDHFKLINDGYGHQVGDQALALFSSVLTRATRVGTDILCRWGGEEFAILLPDTDMCTATEIIGRVQELLARDSVTQPPAFTSSWGLADMRGSLGTAVADADKALYQAKADGRNRYVVAHLDTASPFGPATAPVQLEPGLV